MRTGFETNIQMCAWTNEPESHGGGRAGYGIGYGMLSCGFLVDDQTSTGMTTEFGVNSNVLWRHGLQVLAQRRDHELDQTWHF